jgi:SUKH-4 immunity protein
VPVTYADIIAVWSEHNVVRVRAIGTEFSLLPDNAWRVLAEVGLPREADFRFTRPDSEWVATADGAHKYCKIGSDYGTDICIVTHSSAHRAAGGR